MADPDPNESFGAFAGNGTVGESDSNSPESANFLEAERGVSWIGLEQSEILVRQVAHLRQKVPIVKPESGCREVLQSGVQRPASNSRSASVMR